MVSVVLALTSVISVKARKYPEIPTPSRLKGGVHLMWITFSCAITRTTRSPGAAKSPESSTREKSASKTAHGHWKKEEGAVMSPQKENKKNQLHVGPLIITFM